MPPSRRETRHDIALFIGLAENPEDAATPLGTTRNVSRSGVYMLTSERPPIGARRHIALVWGEETFACWAEVIRHGEDGVAFAFVEAEPGFEGALDEILGPRSERTFA